MREVVVSKDHRLVFCDAAEPEPGPGEVVIAVKAISLIRGEVRKSRTVDEIGHLPGWDLAGVVGHFATQLARLAGAEVIAAVRSETQLEYAIRHGAHQMLA